MIKDLDEIHEGAEPMRLTTGWLVLAGLMLLGFLSTSVAWAADASIELIEVRKIWDGAPHNAFTDLIRYRDEWFCAFREGQNHVSADGAIRILSSTDGAAWVSAARLTSPDSDLRDPKLSITPDGQLMLIATEALHDKTKHTHQSLAWFSENGRAWGEKHPIGDPDFWLWRVTWHQSKAYGVGYWVRGNHTRLYSGSDGKRFEPIVERMLDAGYPNEASLAFKGETAYCLQRCEAEPGHALLGVSQPPYTDWEWKDLGKHAGGPQVLLLPDGRLLAAVRLYDAKPYTALCWIDPEAGALTEALRLPSGGDTSYAGLAYREGQVWVIYYSSHEGKTAIYLAKVGVGMGG